MSQQTYRPGQPDGQPWWWPILAVTVVGLCSAAGLLVIASAAVLAWYLRFYLAVWFALSISLTAVVYVFYLITRRDWRPRTTGYTLLASLALFVLWVVNR